MLAAVKNSSDFTVKPVSSDMPPIHNHGHLSD